MTGSPETSSRPRRDRSRTIQLVLLVVMAVVLGTLVTLFVTKPEFLDMSDVFVKKWKPVGR